MPTTQLTALQLFTPAPSGVGPYGTGGGATVGAVPQNPGTGTWLGSMLYIATTVQLPTTAWQPGGPERTILATEAVCFALSDAVISQMAQGGFLQPAATGTVTYTTPQGQTVTAPVTPDPSNPAQNPTGAPGYLDLLAANVYDVERLDASYAAGPLAIVKLSAGTLTYAGGAYHVGNVLSGATYANAANLSIPASASAGGGIAAITPGVTTTITTTGAHGLVVGASIYLQVPTSSGITGLAGVFAQVSAVTTTTFLVGVVTSGTYTSGGAVYTCTVATMIADLIGIGSNAGPGLVTTTITQNANVFASNLVGWSGANWESNPALAGRCVLSLAARSPDGPSQAYEYFALTAAQILAAETPPVALAAGPITQAAEFSTPGTGIVTTVVASASPVSSVLGQPVTPGAAGLAVTGVSLAALAVVTVAASLGLTSSAFTVTISGVLGPAVNGTFVATYVSSTSFSIPVNTSAGASYAGGGTVEGGDLGQVDAIIQQNCVPDNTTALTVSALALPIVVAATVLVPAAYVTAYQLAAVTQLGVQLASYGIGGATAGVTEVSWNDIVGALEDAGIPAPGQASYAHVQSLSLNGGGTGAGVAFVSNLYLALLATPSITVVGT
jgi:hypothetical protein